MADPIGRNPLHGYVNYTYLLSLHLLDKDTYNELSDSDSKNNYRPDSILIASAGLRTTTAAGVGGAIKTTFGRNALWNEDFYFETMKLDTVVGLGSQSRGTNAIMVDFVVVEPMGATLLERLIETSLSTQYMDYRNMVFALQIDFVGYDDDGTPKRLYEQTKIIPIKLLSIGFKISERGSEYAISAVPYNHQAMQSSSVSIPKHLSVSASTVVEYFTSQVASGYPVLDTREKIVASRKGSLSNEVYSVCDALNQHQQDLKTKGHQAQADVYQIIFDDVIANSKLNNDPLLVNKDNTKMGDSKKPNPRAPISYGITTRQINAGTVLIDEINRIVRNSEYFLSQLPDPVGTINESQAQLASKVKGNVLKWWKIIPKIKLLEYDYKRKDYAKEITYIVKPYNVYSSMYPGTPNGTPPISRKYEYIFSGKNTDILNFDINFDTSYFIAMSTNVFLQSDNSRINDTTRYTTDADQVSELSALGRNADREATSNVTVRSVVGQSAAVATQEKQAQDPRSIAAADIQEYLLNTRSGDMITLDMTIVGDPALIKQDDVFSGWSSRPEDLNGSIPMDVSEVYIEVVFKTPSDYKDDTGLLDNKYDTRTRQSKFSGLYKLIQIDNMLERGQFTQKIFAVRIFTDELYNGPPVGIDQTGTNSRTGQDIRNRR